MMRRRFEFVQGKSNRFWEIWIDDTVVVHTRFGKIGADGRRSLRVARTAAQAAKMVEKMVAEKTARGYEEVAAPAKKARKPGAQAALSKSAETVARAASKFPAKIPLAFPPGKSDINHGVIVLQDGNADLLVIEPGKEPRKVELDWRSKRYRETTIPANISGLKIVVHEEPCLAVSWQNNPNDGMNPANDGPGLGLFRLDGSPIAIRYFHDLESRNAGAANSEEVYDFIKLLTVSLKGDKLVWQQGYSLQAITVTDFVAGRDAQQWKDLEPRWAALDERGVVYATKGVEGFVFESKRKPKQFSDYATRLHAFGEGLIGEDLLISNGKIRAIKSKTWTAAIEGKAGDFTLSTAAGTGDLVCVGPGSFKKPHLFFVSLRSGKVLSVKKCPRRSIFELHLIDDTLYIIDDKEVRSMPWPKDGKCG